MQHFFTVKGNFKNAFLNICAFGITVFPSTVIMHPEGLPSHHSSETSIPSSCSNNIEGICRICHSEGEPNSPLISPCFCTGSIGYVHNLCLLQWIKNSETRSCEICKFNFIMHKKIKPFRKVCGCFNFTSFLPCILFLLFAIVTKMYIKIRTIFCFFFPASFF